MFHSQFIYTEKITSIVGGVFYKQFLTKNYVRKPKREITENDTAPVLKPSKPGVIITIARQHGSSGKQIGKHAAEKLNISFYYKEMIALAAHESRLDRDFISDIHKNAPDILRELYLSFCTVRYAVKAQNEIIR